MEQTKKTGLKSFCKLCNKDYDRENVENRQKTHVNFRLFRKTKRRIHHALNGESKSSSTKNLLEKNCHFYRKWMEFQMNPKKIG